MTTNNNNSSGEFVNCIHKEDFDWLVDKLERRMNKV